MRFLVDAQLPPALARWLRAGGHEAEHVEELGLRAGSDRTIWERALQTGAIIVTKDEDFAARSAQAGAPPIIVWLRVGNSTNRALLSWLGPRMPGIEALLAQGSLLVEVV